MKLLAKSLVFSLLFFFFALPAFAALYPVPNPGGNNFATLDNLNLIFANVVSVVSTFIGFAFLIMLIRGGVGYMTAQGDPKALASARASITWAIVGFIVVLAAFAIISLIAGFVSLPGIGRFCIPKGGGIPYNCTDVHI